MSFTPEIAIIDSNTLASIGMKMLLKSLLPQCTVRIFRHFTELIDDTPDAYIHYFVSATIYMEHSAFFLPRLRKTIVLANESPLFKLADVRILNISLPEKELICQLLAIYREGHPQGTTTDIALQPILSTREIEVLRLLVQGFINKEIAVKLGISLTTVITHRKNITEKLGIKSVSGLTIYAVINGYIEADQL